MRIKSGYKKALLLIVLPAVCWLFFNSIYYRHLHQESTGFYISHAHPYDIMGEKESESSIPNHEHSESEYFIINLFSNSILTKIIIFFAVCGVIISQAGNLFFPIKQGEIQKSYYFVNSSRAPPF